MLLFLQEKLSLQEIERVEQKLEEFRGEKMNREYWEEAFYCPYNFDKKEEKRILDIYDIDIVDDMKRVKFTTNINEQLLKEIKMKAIEENRNVNEIIEEQLEKYLKK